MRRTVLITGAGGFVGSHLVEGFLALGDQVIGVDRAFDPHTRHRLSGARLIEQDLAGAMQDAIGTVDLVIHGAAITTPPEQCGLTDAQHIAANVALVAAALELATAHGARDFVFLSSSGVFAPEDGDGVHLESTVSTACLPYALAKRAGEDATAAAHGQGLRAIAVRLGPIYGPAETPRSTRMTVSQIRRWLDRVTAGEPIMVEMPDERRDWTFAPDLAHGLDALLQIEPAITGVVHLTSADIISNLDLAKAVAGMVDGRVDIVAGRGALRLPMASDRIDMQALHSWTPLATGLSCLLEEVAP